VPDGRIVVVGGKRNAVEIAQELATARTTCVALGSSIGTALRKRSGRAERVGRVVDADGDQFVLVTGKRPEADAVLWATGYRPHQP
jgi:precorrin-6x reductase